MKNVSYLKVSGIVKIIIARFYNYIVAKAIIFQEVVHDIAIGRDRSLHGFREDIPEDVSPINVRDLHDIELKKAVLDLLKERTKLYEEQTERAELSAETYLWLANAGFSAAIITLESRTGAILMAASVRLALCFFLVSISIIGWIKAFRIIRNYRLRGQFRKFYIQFISSEISFQQLTNLDRNVSREPKLLIYPAWVCYILFFASVLFSVYGIFTR